jgi:sigma-B regulation protein RsbU (phosphoserine phosphatase)
MTDSEIRKKRSPSGSLTRRILSVAILLLVIPLFLQSLFLYRQEYSQRLADVQEDLRVLAQERARFIEEVIQMDWEILEQSRWFLHIGPGAIPHPPQNGAFSGGPARNVKPLYIERIPLPRGTLEHFVVVSKSQNAILAGIAESDTTALVMPIPFSVVGRDLPRMYPIQISLMKNNGKILWQSGQLNKPKEVIEASDPVDQTNLKVHLQVDKSQIQGLHLQSYYLRFASLIFFVGVLGGGAVFFFTRRMARPLRRLSQTMQRVSEGASHARFTPDKMGFEINALGLQFNDTLDNLLLHEEQIQKERIGREKLAKELSIGHAIQESLLPSHVLGFPGVDLATSYLAAREVNGDFYDLFTLPNGQLLINICDTAGKGISACLFSLGLRSIIRSFASVTPDLSELVRRTNDLYLIDAHKSSMFSTLWIGIYDPKTKTLTYCSQGHPPALLLRGSQLEELKTDGIAIGAQKTDVIPTKQISLINQDLLVLYTDGILEAHNLENQLFGKERLYDCLLRKQKESAQQIADHLIEEIQLFSHATIQHDDITLLVMRIS